MGGLAVFAEEHIAHLVQVMPNKNEDSNWVKLKKELCGEREDIFIGTFYVSPHNNNNNIQTDFFNKFDNEIKG